MENKVALPFGLYEDDILVGFLMIGYGAMHGEEPKVASGNYCIWRFMIDKAYQGKGFSKKAMEIALDYIKTYPCGPSDYVWLSYDFGNDVAKSLYNAMGFKETGEICDSEIVASRKLY